MEDTMKEDVGLTATQLLGSLQAKPLCDDADVQELTPEQQAALHAFLHETIAAYYRMRMLIPEDRALAVLNKRFAKAAKEVPRGRSR
jgi:hypothetical protein